MKMRAILLTCLLIAAGWVGGVTRSARAADHPDRPNVLWIVAEDINPQLGCYGDKYAETPNIDKLASQGVRYTYAFSNAGVCAIARTTLITGMYAPSLGSEFMRCDAPMPAGALGYPTYLRRAGYYCTNHAKTDYNWANPPMKQMWDASNRKATYENRKKGQSFFAIFNIETSHEHMMREPAYSKGVLPHLKPGEVHDPAKAPVPAYFPDVPEVRTTIAHYYDSVTAMDKQVGVLLRKLDESGQADNTIVFFYGDHGSGLPRSKRWCYNSSTIVPLIIRFPKKWQKYAPAEPGGTCDRLVSFVDFGPTLLSMCGVKPPAIMQGEAFAGPFAAAPRQYVYNYRDRMDEHYDMIRAVRDHRFDYIRNYHPELPWFHDQACWYNLETPALAKWQQLSEAGKLSGTPAIFMAPRKPVEELYDDQADPDEVHNLAGDAKYADVLDRMRGVLTKWEDDVVDLGFLSEPELRHRFGDVPPYDAVRKNPASYPMDRIRAAADLANAMDPKNLDALVKLLDDSDASVRYWAATGLKALGPAAKPAMPALTKAMQDDNAIVRIPAAETLARFGKTEPALDVLAKCLDDKNEWTRLTAANAIERLGPIAKPIMPAVKKADNNDHTRGGGYVVRVTSHILGKDH